MAAAYAPYNKPVYDINEILTNVIGFEEDIVEVLTNHGYVTCEDVIDVTREDLEKSFTLIQKQTDDDGDNCILPAAKRNQLKGFQRMVQNYHAMQIETGLVDFGAHDVGTWTSHDRIVLRQLKEQKDSMEKLDEVMPTIDRVENIIEFSTEVLTVFGKYHSP